MKAGSGGVRRARDAFSDGQSTNVKEQTDYRKRITAVERFIYARRLGIRKGEEGVLRRADSWYKSVVSQLCKEVIVILAY